MVDYKKTELVGVKMNKKMYADLEKIANKEDITIPQLIRMAMKRVIKVA